MAIHLKPSTARVALFIRTDPEAPTCLTAELQEKELLNYCAALHVRVVKRFFFECDEAESLRQIETLLPTLQPEVNTLLAFRFHRFSSNLLELSQISLRARFSYHIDLYSSEFVSPLWTNLHVTNNPYDKHAFPEQ